MKNLIVLKAAIDTVVREYRFSGSVDETDTDLQVIEHMLNTVCMPGVNVRGAMPLDLDDPKAFAYAIVMDSQMEDVKEVIA